MKFDKDEIKDSLTIEQIYDIVEQLGGEPINHGDYLVCRTICHNGDSHKLYYYDNTHLFQCWTNCGSFDIFELLIKIKGLSSETWTLYNAMTYIANFFSLEFEQNFNDNFATSPDWKILLKWEQNKDHMDIKKSTELPIIDKKIIEGFPQPIIAPWVRDGISYETMKKFNIYYNPISGGVLIPHYDINNNLIGIRERTLIKENEVQFGKYRPAIINGKMYNHPLSYNLYNLNNSKDNIRSFQKAIVFESEKSCMQYVSMFGSDVDISVAVCGSSLLMTQINLLLSLGVNEIIIGFDKQFKEIGDEEFNKWIKKLTSINDKYSSYCKITFLFDKWGILKYKSSPTDEGKEKFLMLYNRRFSIA